MLFNHKVKALKITVLAIVVFCLFFIFITRALRVTGAMLTQVSDTITTSVPGAGAGHDIKFTLSQPVPAGGTITILPQSSFNILPTLGYADLQLLVAGNAQNLGAVPDSTTNTIGVSINSGNAGSIIFSLNSSSSFPRNTVEIRLASPKILNPQSVGSFKIDIKTQDQAGGTIDYANAMVAILNAVNQQSGNNATAPLDNPGSFILPNTSPSPSGSGSGYQDLYFVNNQSPNTGFIDYSHRNYIYFLNDFAGDLNLDVPKLFWLKPVNFQINSFDPGFLGAFGIKNNKNIIGSIFRVSASDVYNNDVFNFAVPVVINVNYGALSDNGNNKGSLGIYEYNIQDGTWHKLETLGLNLKNRLIKAQITQTGYVALMDENKASLVKYPCLLMDLNCDNKVDLVDLSILMANWGLPKNSRADINGDGIVDINDLDILKSGWTGPL